MSNNDYLDYGKSRSNHGFSKENIDDARATLRQAGLRAEKDADMEGSIENERNRQMLYRDYPQIRNVIKQICQAYPTYYKESNIEVEKLGDRAYSVNWKYKGEYTKTAIEVSMGDEDLNPQSYGHDHYIYAEGGSLQGDEYEEQNEFLNFLIANELYFIDGVFLFKTDNYLRTSWVWGDITGALNDDDMQRSQRDYSRDFSDWVSENGYSSDVTGHIISEKFNGPTEIINVVPMNATFVTSGEWANDYERKILQAVNDGHDVSTYIELVYEGDYQRPWRFRTSTTINDLETNKSYQNKA